MGKQSGAAVQNGYKAAFLSGLIFCGVFLLLLFGLSALYHFEVLPQGREVLLGRSCLVLTALCASWAAGRHSGRSRMLFGLLSAVVLLFFTLFVGVFTKSTTIINISFLYNAAAIISGSLIGGILSAGRKKRRLQTQKITKRNHYR